MASGSVERAVIVRYSEIAVKGPQTRKRMEHLLINALEDSLKRRDIRYGSIEILPGRIIIEEPDDPENAANAASHVFGVKSASPALVIRFSSLENIVDAGRTLFSERVKGKIFRVRARRAGTHTFTSKDVERLLGAALLEAGARGVDLENPEYTAYVEVRDNRAYFYDEIYEGPGGLPLGSEEPVLVLYSGGFDSTVAAWLIMRRGATVGLMLYNMGVEEAVRNAVETARVMAEKWVYGSKIKLYIADFAPIVSKVRQATDPGYTLLVVRRLMLEHACKHALSEGYEALATGESIGQVASQTVRNIRLIGSNLCLPVFRPISGMDKDEVAHLASKIGIYEHVARQIETCRGRPVPRASPRVYEENLRRAREAIGKLEDIKIKIIELPELS